MRNFFISLMCLFIFLLLSGCATIYRTSDGLAKGLYEDTKNAWSVLKKANQWWSEKTW